MLGNNRNEGIVLIVVLMAMTLMAALGSALMTLAITETKIAAQHRDGTSALYAADAALERVIGDLTTTADWDGILNGTVLSAFVDGPAGGTRALPDGTTIDLTASTNALRCAKATACSDDDMNAVTADRPWGTNNPRWQLYAYGPPQTMIAADAGVVRNYVIVWIADDPAETDGDPLRDSEPSGGPGRGQIVVLAHGYGQNGTRRAIEATVARTDGGIRMMAWRELR